MWIEPHLKFGKMHRFVETERNGKFLFQKSGTLVVLLDEIFDFVRDNAGNRSKDIICCSTMPTIGHISSFLFTLLAAMLMVGSISCSVKTGTTITKVNPYHLKPGGYIATEEKMIDFEFRRKIYGAVDGADYHARYGNYFTVYWRTDQPDSPVTVRLQYRQATSGPKTFVEEKVVDAPLKSNSTNFEIIGDDYAKRGAVTQWKASIIQEGAVLDEFQSFLWQ